MIEETAADALLNWYDRHARRLPWRAPPGRPRADPYHVWLSEIMLQQTTVATVRDYFERFIALWPTVEDLAAADLDRVLTEWAGLGYYARARNLHKCARTVADTYAGHFPDTEDALLDLPGIGRYTAAAITAIAFDRRAVVMDGNVERVVTRLNAVESPLPDSKPILYGLTDAMTPTARAGDFAQAMMDLGATICTPRKPRCMLCPFGSRCAGRDRAEDLPRRKPKKAKPTRWGRAYWLQRADGAVLLRRRPESGLLGGMMEVPSTAWREEPPPALQDGAAAMPVGTVGGEPREVGEIRHTFTHFHLRLSVAVGAAVDAALPDDCIWCLPDRLGDVALPTVMRKVARAALGAADKENNNGE